MTGIYRYERPYTDEERNCLHDVLTSLPKSCSLWRLFASTSACLIVALGCFALTFTVYEDVQLSVLAKAIWILVLVAIAVVLLIVAVTSIPEHFEHVAIVRQLIDEDFPTIRIALDDNRAFVLRVDAASVIQIFDRGCYHAFLFDLGAGATLYLRDDRYFPLRPTHLSDTKEEYDDWPALRFEIVRTSQGRFVGVFAPDHRVEPGTLLQMTDFPAAYASSRAPRTETIIPASAEQVANLLMTTGNLSIR